MVSMHQSRYCKITESKQTEKDRDNNSSINLSPVRQPSQSRYVVEWIQHSNSWFLS
jgi:hypothetical protein